MSDVDIQNILGVKDVLKVRSKLLGVYCIGAATLGDDTVGATAP